ncbi:MAG: DUF3038 domain-containing protein [Cyanobacteriota bacterium]|nr:DUF3038 domain-containing protein [Cyanobacteriota bacterium]
MRPSIQLASTNGDRGVSQTSSSTRPARGKWENLPLTTAPDPVQLDNIKTQIDLVLLALETLAGIGSEEILQAAANLDVNTTIADRVTLWRLRQSNPLRNSSGGRKKLDVEEARSLVAIAAHLAKQHQELIRRAVALLEQLAEQNRPPHQAALLGDYLDAFTNTYQERMHEGDRAAPERLAHLALKLLIDLLFYSGPGGDRRLWMALLERSSQSQ